MTRCTLCTIQTRFACQGQLRKDLTTTMLVHNVMRRCMDEVLPGPRSTLPCIISTAADSAAAVACSRTHAHTGCQLLQLNLPTSRAACGGWRNVRNRNQRSWCAVCWRLIGWGALFHSSRTCCAVCCAMASSSSVGMTSTRTCVCVCVRGGGGRGVVSLVTT
jgi:hypothetical protein